MGAVGLGKNNWYVKFINIYTTSLTANFGTQMFSKQDGKLGITNTYKNIKGENNILDSDRKSVV